MPTSDRIHPTAIISPHTILGEDVQIGPYAVVDGPVRIGSGCVIGPQAYLCGPLTMGARNIVHAGAVIGERPQHMKYNDEETCVEIGDGNVFREHVTVHRGTSHSWKTVIGNNNYFMVNSHIAHDCRIGNRCIFANGALVGGHCTIEDNVNLSGNSALHQFVRVGRLAFVSGCSASTKDVPPFIMCQGIDTVVGINVIGMRRAGVSSDQITAVRQAYHILFRQGLVLPAALARLEQEYSQVPTISEMVAFIRQCPKGISPVRDRRIAA
jgi:UDP-N-acetylglucosamine acyltransferase